MCKVRHNTFSTTATRWRDRQGICKQLAWVYHLQPHLPQPNRLPPLPVLGRAYLRADLPNVVSLAICFYTRNLGNSLTFPGRLLIQDLVEDSTGGFIILSENFHYAAFLDQITFQLWQSSLSSCLWYSSIPHSRCDYDIFPHVPAT